MTHEEAISVISNVAWLGNESDRKKIERAIKKLSESPTCSGKPNNWIPVSERLPEGIGQVIIQTNGGAIHEAFYRGKNDYGHEVWMRLDGVIYWDDEVVAWQPLPEPYKGSGCCN